ncbi:MAG: SGNH/GDSL hydrolase family protein [Planctomycetota bacterium]
MTHTRPIFFLAIFTALLGCSSAPVTPYVADRSLPATPTPAEIRYVSHEAVVLPSDMIDPDRPGGFNRGAKLQALRPRGPGLGVPAPGAIDPGSVTVRFGAIPLQKNLHYTVDPLWGTIGRGTNATHFLPLNQGAPQIGDTVHVSYRYSLRRIDSEILLPTGQTILRRGQSHLTAPQPPALQPGETRLANLFVDYFDQPPIAPTASINRFPILATPDLAPTRTTPGHTTPLPKTLAKIRAGEPVKIVCWGDSVTVGGDATEGARYADVFARRLAARFPGKPIDVQVIAVGGSNSRQWLYPDRYPGRRPEDTRFQHILDEAPDLVTIEFVNDAGMQSDDVAKVYDDILQRLAASPSNPEVILITPHFTRPEMMGFTDLRQVDRRPYVLALRQFAEERGIALADASARWQHLWREGLPYVTLLYNGINHPDDRGHAIFADELMKCFE